MVDEKAMCGFGVVAMFKTSWCLPTLALGRESKT
jgi:hypothetical protein